MPLDRDATLKQAEKLLRQGRLEGAIAEYVRLVQDQPRDWNAINALGDLYIRAGDREAAVEQFTRIADHMFAEGFVPKASALYKKALKAKPDHDHSLLRLSDIAARQGLLVDARQYLKQLGRLRRDRGDQRGSAEVLIRMALLDEADGDTQLAGARAAQALGRTEQAVVLFRLAADSLTTDGRRNDAHEALAAAAALDPADEELRRRLARAEPVPRGGASPPSHAGDAAGNGPDQLLAMGHRALAAGREAEARIALTRLITLAPHKSSAVHDLATELAAKGSMSAALVCTEVLVDDALLAGEWDRALTLVEALLQHGMYIPALVKLVELAVDARRDDVIESAQARLADAYIEAGNAEEGRRIAEDLVARHPRSEQHVDRLRRALSHLDVEDADAIANRYRDATDGLGCVLELEEQPRHLADHPAGPASTGAPIDRAESFAASAQAEDSDAIVLDMLEVDLSEALADLNAAAPGAEVPPQETRDLDAVFDDLRRRVARAQPGGDGSDEYDRGLRQLEQGRLADAAVSLRTAARMPLYRFRASAQLARLYLRGGNTAEAIEWLERAAEAPAPAPEDGWSVLYDLADALERIGEGARALAVLLELEADAGAYRDVRQRIDLLSRAQAGRR